MTLGKVSHSYILTSLTEKKMTSKNVSFDRKYKIKCGIKVVNYEIIGRYLDTSSFILASCCFMFDNSSSI